MQLRPQGWLYVAAAAAFASGCASPSRTTDEDARAARLPTGVTLLDSNREECAGPVAIDDSVIAGAREDLVVQRGENATFEVDADADEDIAIRWTCVGSVSAERESVGCPEETSHVRVTRATGNDFLLECYGNRGSSSSRARR
jgi:hypothetical protein